MQSDGKKLVEQLQRLGAAELDKMRDERFEDMQVSDIVSVCEKNLHTVSEALEILDRYAPLKQGISMFSGRQEISYSDYSENVSHSDEVFRCALDIINCDRTVADAAAEISRCEALLSGLEVWKNLDIPMNTASTRMTKIYIGSFPKMYDKAGLLSEVSRMVPQINEFDAEIVYSSKIITTAMVICHKEVSDAVYSALRQLGFTAAKDVTGLTPSQYIAKTEEDKKKASEKSDKARADFEKFGEKRPELKFLFDSLTVKRDEYSSLENAKLSGKTILMSGYLVESRCGEVKKLCNKVGAAVVFSEPSEDDDVPVKLKNNAFCEPVESITEMYALPGKKDIDPSSVMAFFYYLLFGMMLSDAGYGLIMTIATAIILNKTKVEGNMRRSLKMFFYCGISTVFWGALFGSWFGDIIPVICTNFLGYKTAPSIALWFEPIQDPIKLLMFSFIVGMCHLFAGLITFGYMEWRDGRKLSAILDTVPTLFLVLGAAPLAAGVIINVPQAITGPAKYLAIAGVILVIFTAARDSKNIFAKLGGGLYGLYNIASGYLSDILSYSRLLALGLATGSIASVVNMIGVMPDSKPAKAVMLALVFLIGHPLNMAINVLGAYVHANRLQFVELFSKFYEGGGRAFEPLRINTKYYKLKEDSENE